MINCYLIPNFHKIMRVFPIYLFFENHGTRFKNQGIIARILLDISFIS